jgi:hypothetical protein
MLLLLTLVFVRARFLLLLRQIDQNHPSRIDFYGQMFQKFPEGTDTMMQKGASVERSRNPKG